jgi:hypothetical protein
VVGGFGLCGKEQAPCLGMTTEAERAQPVATELLDLWSCFPVMRDLLQGRTESSEPGFPDHLSFTASSLLWVVTGGGSGV